MACLVIVSRPGFPGRRAGNDDHIWCHCLSSPFFGSYLQQPEIRAQSTAFHSRPAHKTSSQHTSTHTHTHTHQGIGTDCWPSKIGLMGLAEWVYAHNGLVTAQHRHSIKEAERSCKFIHNYKTMHFLYAYSLVDYHNHATWIVYQEYVNENVLFERVWGCTFDSLLQTSELSV